MKKINIELNTKSIENAISRLKRIEKLIKDGEVKTEFLDYVCKWIIKQADTYIDRADLGSLIKTKLHESWSYTIGKDGAKITNNANVNKSIGGKTQTVPISVLIEFGTGLIGQRDPHPQSKEQGYQYNVKSQSKSFDGAWTFYTNENELDLPVSSLLAHNYYNGARGKDGQSGMRLLVMTKGAEGVMYAYNAIIDANNSLINGELARKWNEILERYIG